MSFSVLTVFYIISWFVLNISIGTVNKSVFYFHHFEYPVFLTAMHMLTCYALGYVVHKCMNRGASFRNPSPSQRTRLWILSLLFAISVASGNIALKHVFVSFAQMLGATTPLVTILLSAIILGKSYTFWQYFSMVPITCGVMLCTYGEINFHLLGCFHVALYPFVMISDLE